MKRAAAILSLILLASCVTLAQGDKNTAQLAIDGKAETVKQVAVQVLREAGYSVSVERPNGIEFTKEMTGHARFFVSNFLSAPTENCPNVPPRLYVTLDLKEVGRGTLATMSTVVEHTVQEANQPRSVYTVPPLPYQVDQPYYQCNNVREAPTFMHTQKMLTGVLKEIRLETITAPRKPAPPPLSADR